MIALYDKVRINGYKIYFKHAGILTQDSDNTIPCPISIGINLNDTSPTNYLNTLALKPSVLLTLNDKILSYHFPKPILFQDLNNPISLPSASYLVLYPASTISSSAEFYFECSFSVTFSQQKIKYGSTPSLN